LDQYKHIEDSYITPFLLSHFGRVKTPAFRRQLQHFFFSFGRGTRWGMSSLVKLSVMRTIGEADLANFSCYPKPPASAGEAFTNSFYQ
jgi:hypothetical protein